ncbi:2-dehydro-3-deoxy-D-gluconate 5-dehydrogenase KduD [Pelagibacterium limicola]|uniref:2-dehydro-3-deoxy-D-gluconate 5-dehydrogenase KduD n=1 Tax=Pelagibacterium limicola TaxID=2791022 RepID=UPI0018AFF0DA|nr:2-dehydro-3-deoxy-D-gluconate 5-dehydrogenase KduD [Pelagibacterium limicola]
MTNCFDLSGRRAFVTGANTGIGQAIACALAAAGAEIIAVGRSSMAQTQAVIRPMGRSCEEVLVDLGDVGAAVAAFDAAWKVHGPIDILVNNAGIIRRRDAVDFTEEDWDAVLDLNLKTAFFLSQALARNAFAAERGGKIINIASLLSFQGGIRIPSYTASKSGLAGITRLLACEWAARGINVNAIAPGYIETSNTDQLRNDETRFAEISARIPAGRWGQPKDIGGAAVFLASDAGAYVHGIVLPVDGGWLAR